MAQALALMSTQKPSVPTRLIGAGFEILEMLWVHPRHSDRVSELTKISVRRQQQCIESLRQSAVAASTVADTVWHTVPDTVSDTSVTPPSP